MHRRSTTLTLLLLLSVTLTASVSAQQSWPGFRGPQGDGRAVEGLPSGDAPLRLEKRWIRPLGSGYSGIVAVDGLLVTATSAGERDVVVALDAVSGDERWRADLDRAYKGHDGSHDGPISTPTIADGRVFALSPWGRLVALEVSTGRELWAVDLIDALQVEKPLYGFGSSPTVVDGVVVLQTGGDEGSVVAFDVGSGELRWRSVPDENDAQSPIVAELDGKRQVVVIGATRVAGLDPSDGSVLWQMEHGGGRGAFGAPTSSPVPLGDSRLLLKYDSDSTRVLRVRRGGEGWESTTVTDARAMTRSYSPPTAWGEQVYGYTARFLSSLDLETGELLWRSREPGDGFLVSVGGYLAVLTKEGTLHLGVASPEGWEELHRAQLFGDLAWTPPSYADGALFVRSLSEIARVDLVRSTTMTADASGSDAIPPEIETMSSEIAAGGDPAVVVDRFLEGRELPVVDGDRVLFLWRGDARDVAIAGDMIGMRREESMNRLAGSDLWWWQTELDPRVRMSYLFFVDYEPTVDPSHERTVTSTVLGPDMNWQRSESMEMSWFAGPDWPGWKADARGESDAEQRGRIEAVELEVARPGEDAQGTITVPLQVWLPPGYDDSERRYPVLFVHHPKAREVGGWIETLDRVVGRTVEPLIVTFVEGRSPRQAFLAEIVPAIDGRYRTSADRSERGNVGMAWPGLGAVINTFQASDQFGVLGVQSFYALTAEMEATLDAIGDQTAEDTPMRIYYEWGEWDLVSPHEQMNMRQSSRQLWEQLVERGWQPVGGAVWDSTDFASWSNRTQLLLEALYPLDGEGPPAGLERWLTAAP